MPEQSVQQVGCVRVKELRDCQFLARGRLLAHLDTQRRDVLHLIRRGYAVVPCMEADEAVRLAAGVSSRDFRAMAEARLAMELPLRKLFRHKLVFVKPVSDATGNEDGVALALPAEQSSACFRLMEYGASTGLPASLVSYQDVAVQPNVADDLSCCLALSQQGKGEQRMALVAPRHSEPVQCFCDRFSSFKREQSMQGSSQTGRLAPHTAAELQWLTRNAKLIHNTLKAGQLLVFFRSLPCTLIPAPLPAGQCRRGASITLLSSVVPRSLVSVAERDAARLWLLKSLAENETDPIYTGIFRLSGLYDHP
jgi:hypothetical protein